MQKSRFATAQKRILFSSLPPLFVMGELRVSAQDFLTGGRARRHFV
jgi:hypothetical protein